MQGTAVIPASIDSNIPVSGEENDTKLFSEDDNFSPNNSSQAQELILLPLSFV